MPDFTIRTKRPTDRACADPRVHSGNLPELAVDRAAA